MTGPVEVKWLIEDIFREDTDKMVNALKQLDIEYKITDNYSVLRASDYLNKFGDKDCVVVFGSIQFCGIIDRHAKWIPGAYADYPKYNCSYYYPQLYKYLLNQESQFVPFGLLEQQKELLYERYGSDNCIFIRPDKGTKLFTGQVFAKEIFDKEMNYIKDFHQVNPSELCVVAKPYKIKDEYRFIVVGDTVVTGSYYRVNGVVGNKNADGTMAHKFAQHVVNKTSYRPNRVWCLDICKCGDRYYVVEVGGFSCAGLYECDRVKLIPEVNRVAMEEWQEYHCVVY